MFLVGDLAECHLENINKAEVPFFSNRILLKSVVDLTASSDLDLQEKVLLQHFNNISHHCGCDNII